jgi:hypothetical protein
MVRPRYVGKKDRIDVKTVLVEPEIESCWDLSLMWDRLSWS